MPHMNKMVLAVLLVAAAGSSADAQGTKRRPAPPSLCSFVTEAEAESILGKRLAPPQTQRNGDCWYMREGGSDFGDVEVILSALRGRVFSETQFDAFVAAEVKHMNDRMKKSGVGMIQYTAKRAAGVGAPAYFVDPGLYVFKKNVILVVGLGGSKGTAIARTALKRMP